MAGSTLNNTTSEQPRHDFRIVRPIAPTEWRDFLTAVPWIWIKAIEGDLADAPDPDGLSDAPQTTFGLGIASDGVTIVSKGPSRVVGRGAILALSPDMPRGYAGICATGDCAHDAAVRLALLLLHRSAPGALELSSTGRLADWQHTAALVAEIMVVFEESVSLPRLTPVRQATVAPVTAAYARRQVMDLTDRTRPAGAQAPASVLRGYVSGTGGRDLSRRSGAASG